MLLPLLLVAMVASGGCTSSTPKTEPSSPPVQMARVEVTPHGDLYDGQRVTVRLSGFNPGSRVRLSECAGAAAVNFHGCGVQRAQQPFVDLDSRGAGTGRLTVTAFALAGASGAGQPVACRARCVLEASGVSGAGRKVMATQPLRFDGSVGRLLAPESFVPAAGACGRFGGLVATVHVDPDVPNPRCLFVRADQELRVVNSSNRYGQRGRTVTVTWPPYAPRRLPVGASTVFTRTLGYYLGAGVHDLRLSLYAGGGAEIWLRYPDESRQASARR